jgi:hypothetical protein
MQRAQFTENWGIQGARAETQYGWRMDDWAYQQNVSQLQFGWQMEDMQQNIRRSTGRQRQDLIRQRGRAVTLHTMEQGQAEEAKSRMEQQREWEIEDHERQMEHFMERWDLQKEQHDLSLQQAKERMGLQMEAHALAQEHFEEDQELAREGHLLSMAEAAERYALDQEQRQVAMAHAKEMRKIEEARELEAEKYAKEMVKINEEEVALQRQIQINQGKWNRWFTVDFPNLFHLFTTNWANFMEKASQSVEDAALAAEESYAAMLAAQIAAAAWGGGDDSGDSETENTYQHGTAYVTSTGRALVHQGEIVYNPSLPDSTTGRMPRVMEIDRVARPGGELSAKQLMEIRMVLEAILSVLRQNNGLIVNVRSDTVRNGIEGALTLADRAWG